MKYSTVRMTLVLAFFLCLSTTEASESFTVGVAVTQEQKNDGRGWPHLGKFYTSSLATVEKAIIKNFSMIPRCRIVAHEATIDSRGQSQYVPRKDVNYIAHFVLRRADKLFRNRTLYYSDPSSVTPLGIEDTMPGETLALPAFSAAIEVRLINPAQRKTLWSTLQDSTVLLPHSNNFVYNVDKYPGYTPPEIIRDYVAPILMQRFRSPSSLRMLQAADRWYISDPSEDAATGGRLLAEMVRALFPYLDAELPLFGTIIAELAPDEKNRPQYRLDIGANQGINLDLKLDVFRKGTRDIKIGELKIISVGASTSAARLHKLERSIKRSGGQLAVGDGVLSTKRPVH